MWKGDFPTSAKQQCAFAACYPALRSCSVLEARASRKRPRPPILPHASAEADEMAYDAGNALLPLVIA